MLHAAVPVTVFRGLRPTLLIISVFLFACDAPAPGPWTEEDGHRWRPLASARGEGPGFRLHEPRSSGVDFANRVETERRFQSELLTHGSGVAIGDVDGDGLPDIYFSRVDGPNALFRNLGDWRFEEVAEASGVALPELDATGAVLADIDGDGDLDLFVTARGQPNRLLVNDGTGRFTDESVEAGVDYPGGSTTAALADVDGDGDLDLYVANYKVRKAGNVFPPSERGFDQVVRRDGDSYVVTEPFREFFRLRVSDEGLVRWGFGEPDVLYLNDGTGRFEPVPWTSGRFLNADGSPLDTIPDEWGLTARFHDVNGDRAPDLYVSNDFESPDHFWINDGRGTFRAVDPLALRNTSASSMAVDFSDVDGDGRTDLFVVDMLARDPQRRRTQIPTIAPAQVAPGESGTRLQHNRNTLFFARSDGTYAEAAFAAGLEASGWSWSTLFLDVDLDGFEDVLVTNGHVWDVLDADTQSRLLNTPVAHEWPRTIDNFPPLLEPNAAFRNRRDGTFEEAASDWGFDLGPDISHGIAAGDLDLDGDLDVVVNRLDAPAALLENRSAAPRVAVTLRGRPPNTRGVGARVTLTTPVGAWSREVDAGGHYLSSSEPLVSLAAPGDGPFTLRIAWRGGETRVIRDVLPGRLYEVTEGAGPPADGAGGEGDAPAGAPAPEPSVARAADRAAGPATAAAGPASADGGPLFEDVSDRLGHAHAERVFNDFARQPLLPHRLSQLGPGVTWTDLDGDGDPDLVVASGGGGTLGLLRNEGGRFAQVPGAPAADDLDQTMVLPLPVAGGTGLLVGRSNYESATPEDAAAAPRALLVLLGPGGRPGAAVAALPGAAGAVGALAAADLDGDGGLEVLVTYRTVPAAYPIASPPEIFGWSDGRLVPDSAAAAGLAGAGPVSGAVFTDLDDDGDPDLVLAIDWGPIRVYANHLGRLTEVTEQRGLAGLTGRWNGITSGDLDGDGRMDLVATGWGRNTRHRPGPARPLRLYAGDFDDRGALDLLEAMPDETGEDRPETDLARLSAAVPTLRLRNVRTFRDFATASVREVLGEDAHRTARVLEASTLDHVLLLNRGDRFEVVPLPALAQRAPAFHAGVADLDGDGHEDVVLSQNFFPNELNVQRYDGGRALVLLGDGTGALEPMAGERSGVRVYGDQRGAALADFDGDGRLDLAISQNGGQTVLLHNRGAAAGLRVRLEGPPGNPRAVGARLRVVYEDGTRGPAREVRLGAGYWSVDGAVQVLGLAGEPAAVEVRWPGAGGEVRVPVPPGARRVDIRHREGG